MKGDKSFWQRPAEIREQKKQEENEEVCRTASGRGGLESSKCVVLGIQEAFVTS